MRLSQARAGSLSSKVIRPRYKPHDHAAGVVHLGVGAFHRAHQAVYFDDLLGAVGGDWRISGVSLRSSAVANMLRPQNCDYIVVERDADDERYRLISSIADVLVAPEQPEEVIARLASPLTKLVTTTITEKGYCHDPASGRLAADHPDVLHDLQNPGQPKTAIGYIIEGLSRRRFNGTSAPTILPCDNLPSNGDVLRGILREFAALRDSGLADWIDREVQCPSTMVDRIVPATTEVDIAQLEQAVGLRDYAMVKTEPFTQWVVEDRFVGDRPDFAAVGVQMVDDVRPFEIAKLRMLNGSHSTIAYLGALGGLTYVHEVINRSHFAVIICHLRMAVAAPTVPLSSNLDLNGYTEALLARFANHALQHRVAQIAIDGSQKIPQRLLGTIRDRIADGRPFDVAVLGVAAWICYATGRNEGRVDHVVDDPLSAKMRILARSSTTANGIAIKFLGLTEVFGDLAQNEIFQRELAAALGNLLSRGANDTASALAQRIRESGSL